MNIESFLYNVNMAGPNSASAVFAGQVIEYTYHSDIGKVTEKYKIHVRLRINVILISLLVFLRYVFYNVTIICKCNTALIGLLLSTYYCNVDLK